MVLKTIGKWSRLKVTKLKPFFSGRGYQGILSGGGDQPVLPLSNVTEAFFLVLLDGWDTQILADLVSQDITDFGVARDGGRRFCAGLCHQE